MAWLRDSLAGGNFAQTCFVAQQVGEKAIIAIAYARGAEVIRSHSILAIARELKINSEIDRAAQTLDQYYITARYPDALPDGYPAQFFTEEQARAAVELAALMLHKAEEEFGDG